MIRLKCDIVFPAYLKAGSQEMRSHLCAEQKTFHQTVCQRKQICPFDMDASLLESPEKY